MIEPLPESPGGGAGEPLQPRSAGALLRAAREREGLHLAVLAATIKVSPAKLEALERDRHDQLPNATFARALAQSVCRSLKIDPRPVLALLPQQDAPPLETATGRLNTPFDDRPARGDGAGLAWASKPMFIAGGALLLAAVAIGLLPRQWVEGWQPPAAPSASAPSAAQSAGSEPASVAPAPAPVASAALPQSTSTVGPASEGQPPPAAVAASAPTAAVTAVVAVSPPALSAASSLAPATAGAVPPAPGGSAASLRIIASAPTWIEVVDAEGQSLLSRIVQPSESLSLDGRRPMRVRVGNVAGTSLTFRGQTVDLAPYTRDNVARLELR